MCHSLQKRKKGTWNHNKRRWMPNWHKALGSEKKSSFQLWRYRQVSLCQIQKETFSCFMFLSVCLFVSPHALRYNQLWLFMEFYTNNNTKRTRMISADLGSAVWKSFVPKAYYFGIGRLLWHLKVWIAWKRPVKKTGDNQKMVCFPSKNSGWRMFFAEKGQNGMHTKYAQDNAHYYYTGTMI